MSIHDRAAAFRGLHARGELLVLPNAWDAISALLFEEAGARAIATSSAALAWSRGYADGGAIPRAPLLDALAGVVRVTRVPVSADIEDGYSANPAEVADLARAVIDAGAVGVNLEDGAAPVDLLARKVEAAKSAAAKAGVDLFVNARTDVYLRRLVPVEQAVEETIARAKTLRDAGADSIFVPALREPAAIRAIAQAIELPLNVLIVPELPPVAELRALGVRRLSAGALPARAALAAARRAVKQLLESGRYDDLLADTVVSADVNARLRSRA